MGLSVSLSLFFVVAVFYIVIIDIFVIFFRSTGMPEEKARFQVVSLLTNSGYTTRESELVVEVAARRKMGRQVMMFGYIFGITVVSVFVSVVLSLPVYERREEWPLLLTMGLLFIIFLLVKRIPGVREYFDAKIEKWSRKKIYGKRENAVVMIDEFDRGSLAKVQLNKVPLELKGKTLKDADLPGQHGIHVIFLERGGQPMEKVRKKTVLEAGDVIAVFGKREQIDKLFGI